LFLILTVILVGPVSCKKQEEAEVEEIQAYMSEEETLGQAMKKALEIPRDWQEL
jgi:hypothetical protein